MLHEKSFQGLLWRCIAWTYALNILLMPLIYASRWIGTDTSFWMSYSLPVWIALLLFSIPWGIYIRKRNQSLLSTDSQKRKTYWNRILLAMALFLVIYCSGVWTYPNYLMINLLTQYVDTSHSVIYTYFDQLWSPFTHATVLVTLAAVFFGKSNQ